MKTLPSPISDAERAVSHFKRPLLVKVMAHIIRRALLQTYVSACDVPEDIIDPEHRQGVASNAWNALSALEILERVPLTLTIEEKKIFGGRIMNTNQCAKGRWVGVYTLAEQGVAKARAWANANGVLLSESELPADKPLVQTEFLTTDKHE